MMIIFAAGFMPGIFLNYPAPLYDRGGPSISSFITPLYGEDKPALPADAKSQPQCDKSKCLCDSSVLYQVMAVTLIIWVGISAYLVFLHVKIAALEKKTNE